MNLFDLGHSLLTGEWKLRRQMVAEQRTFNDRTRGKRELMLRGREMVDRMQLYAGAEPSINRPTANQLSTPEDYKQANERIVLIRAARQLEEDGGFFDGLLDDFETYVVGDCALFLPNTGNDDANKAIREFLEWKFDQADFSNRLDLTKIAQLFVRSMKRDGECGAVPVDTGDSIKLKYYSGDCIGNPTIGAAIGINNYNGIRTDPYTNAPEFYDLFRRAAKMNFYVPDLTVEADHFWHYYDPFRLQQYHGVSVFKNAIRDGFDIDQILEYTKLNIKWRASQLPTVHTETGRPRGAQNGYFGWGNQANGTAPTAANGAPLPMQVNVDGVTTTYLNLEERVMEYPNDFPNTSLQVTIEEFRRQCCKGAKVPYEFAYRADNGGVVQRFWVDKAIKTFGKDKHLLKRALLNPFKNRVIQKGIDTGELDLDRFGDLNTSTARFRGQWQLGSQITVDYGKETDADLKLIEGGLMSPQDKVASMGSNLEEVRDEIKSTTIRIFLDAEEIAKKTGQKVETILPFLVKKYPNPTMPIGGQAEAIPGTIETANKVKPLIESIGVGGSQALAGILQQVSSGALPRESGIQSLVIVFGMSPENAAKLIPDQGSAKPVPGADALPTPAEKMRADRLDQIERAQFKREDAAAMVDDMLRRLPQQTTPQVIHVHAPAITNQMAAGPAPVVHVAAPNITTPAPEISVVMPQGPAPVVNVTVPAVTATLSVERDANGKIKGGKIS